MTTLSPINERWYSAHQKILFGTDMPFFFQAYSQVFDDGNGNAVFNRSAVYPYIWQEYSNQFYIESGIYQGFHSVIEYDSINDYIYTNTPFLGDDVPPAIFKTLYQIVPFGYRIYYGYPTQDNYIDLRAYHKQDGTAYVDIQSVLANTFNIASPVSGYDESMYTYFRIDYIPLGQFAEYLESISLTIDTWTAWDYTLELYYCLNSAIPHSKLQELVLYDKFLCETDPIFSLSCCNVLSKILNNRVYNIITCPEGSSGIGAMEIEDTLIVG